MCRNSVLIRMLLSMGLDLVASMTVVHFKAEVTADLMKPSGEGNGNDIILFL